MSDSPIIGQTITFKATFPGNATALKLYLRPPSGATIDLSGAITGSGTPTPSCDWTASGSGGNWMERWEGTVGGKIYVEEKTFNILPRQVPAP